MYPSVESSVVSGRLTQSMRARYKIPCRHNDAKIWELSAKRAEIMVAVLFNLTAPRFWSIPNDPKTGFESNSKTSKNIASESDLEPFLGRAPVGTLGPRLNV